MHTYVVFRTAMQAPAQAVGISTFSLLASAAALCIFVLPALLTALGFDETATTLHASPLYVIAGNYQGAIFAVSALMLVAAMHTVWRMDAHHCPPDLEQARRYRRLRHWNRRMLGLSAMLWFAAIVIVYVAPAISTALQ